MTDTVRALTRTYLPYRYTGLGTQQLKGIAGGIPLYRVERVPASRSARLRRQLSARRGRVAVVAGMFVVLLAVGAGVYTTNRGPDCLTLPASTKDVVAKIDPDRNCVVATYEVGQRPGPILAANGRLWVGNITDQTVSIIDTTTGHVHSTGAGGTPDALAVGPSSVWVLDTTAGVLSEISLTSERPVTRRVLPFPEFITDNPSSDPIFRNLPSASGYADIAFLGRRVWVTNRVMGQVLPVSPDVGVSQFGPISDAGAIQVGPPPETSSTVANYVVSGTGPVAAAQGTVWMASDQGPELWRIDPGSSKSQSTTLPDHGPSVDLALTTDAVWATHPDGTLTRTSTGSLTTTDIKVGREPSAIGVSDDVVWVANTGDGTISMIDPKTNRVVTTIHVGSNPAGIAIVDGQPFVTLRGP